MVELLIEGLHSGERLLVEGLDEGAPEHRVEVGAREVVDALGGGSDVGYVVDGGDEVGHDRAHRNQARDHRDVVGGQV